MLTQKPIIDIMSKYPVWVDYNQSLKDSLRIMKKHKVSHLPVCNGKTVVGMISKSDLLERTLQIVESSSGKTFSDKLLSSTYNTEFMSNEPIVIGEMDSEIQAGKLMRENLIHALPVVNADNEIKGIVTFYDLIR